MMHLARYDLLIDGYNLMHVAGFARDRYGPRDLERQRDQFLNWLWRLVPPNLRARTVIVFDAGGSDGQYVQQSTHREFRVLYSAQGTEADDVIEELIEVHSAPKRLQVVSSDHRLHKAARRRKATCLDSEAFVALMLRLVRQAREQQRVREELSKPAGELAEETLEWLKVFSEADELLAAEPPLQAPAPRAAVPGRAKRSRVPPPAASSESSSTVQKSAPPGNDVAPGDKPGPTSPVVESDELAFWTKRIEELFAPQQRGSK